MEGHAFNKEYLHTLYQVDWHFLKVSRAHFFQETTSHKHSLDGKLLINPDKKRG